MRKRTCFILVCLLSLLSAVYLLHGCLSISDQAFIIHQRHALASPTELPSEFQVACWNIQKNRKDGWQQPLASFVATSDLVFLQEAYLTKEIQTVLQSHQQHWDLAQTYTFREVKGGVLTTSSILPLTTQALQHPEPIIKTPKSMLITRYPLADSTQTLLAFNVHIINFTLATSPVSEQLLDLGAILTEHIGPVVIGGDFNTWKQKRITLLMDWTHKHRLHTVIFEEDQRSTFFGHPVDYIFYRDLEVVKATCSNITSSDHNPMTVLFKSKTMQARP
jgi:endonuclease/exonuclease/phosphatase (EEP) superfamily protein YafD